jgi:hypothetical protein
MLLGGAAVAWPLAARTQQQATKVELIINLKTASALPHHSANTSRPRR